MSWYINSFLLNAGGTLDHKEFHEEDRGGRAFFKQLVKELHPGSPDALTDGLTDYAGPYIMQSLRDNGRLSLAVRRDQHKLIDLARDLLHSPGFKKDMDNFTTAYKKQNNYNEADEKQVDNIETPVNPPKRDTRKDILRSRFYLPGIDTVKETVAQSVTDTVQSDLFSYQSTNPDTGINNSLYLDNERRDMVNTMGANMPRPPQELEQLVGIGPVPRQWQDTQPVVPIIQNRIVEQMVTTYLQHMPPHSEALHDNMHKDDPFDLPRTDSCFVPVYDLTPELQPDHTQSTKHNYMGLRPADDTWRQPNLKPEWRVVQPMSSEKELRQINQNGFDTMYRLF